MNAMRAVKVFADTNVVFYSREDTSHPKAATAQFWLQVCADRRSLCLNLQVLNELASVLFRKQRQLTNDQVFDAIDKLSVLGAEPMTIQTVQIGRAVRTATGYSWWDSLLLASALELGCSHFLSEDLQDGHQIGGLTIVNPFLHAPEAILGPPQD